MSLRNLSDILAAKRSLHTSQAANSTGELLTDDSEDEEIVPEKEYDEDLDVDTSMDVEADESDAAALLATQIIDYTPGDILGKLLAFINQLRSCSEPTRLYFERICINLGIPPRKLKLWVRTRWGSLHDCFESATTMRKVCTCRYGTRSMLTS